MPHTVSTLMLPPMLHPCVYLVSYHLGNMVNWLVDSTSLPVHMPGLSRSRY